MDKQLTSLVTQQSPEMQGGIGGCGKGTSTVSIPDTNHEIPDERSQTLPRGPSRRGIVGS